LNAHEKSLFNSAAQILWKLVPIWKNFNHPSVAAFRGVSTNVFPLALVYDWAGNGNIIQYLESHPDAPRLVLVLSLLLYDVTRLISLLGHSCCRLRRVFNTFIPSVSRMGI